MPNYGDPSDRTQPTGPEPSDVERPNELERPGAEPFTDVERPSYRDDVDHPGARNDRDDLGLGEGPENAGVGTPTGSLRGMDERDDLGGGRGVPSPDPFDAPPIYATERRQSFGRRGIVIAPAEPGSPGNDVVTVGPEITPAGDDELTDRIGVERRYDGEDLGQGTRPRAIERLEEYLRGEQSAVETYELAIASCKDARLSHELRELCQSHQRRVNLLRERIRTLGAEPKEGSGLWGTFAKLVQRGADLFGTRLALDALEEGEEHGVQMYEDDLDDADARTIDLVRSYLLPEQLDTLKLCQSLRRRAA